MKRTRGAPTIWLYSRVNALHVAMQIDMFVSMSFNVLFTYVVPYFDHPKAEVLRNVWAG